MPVSTTTRFGSNHHPVSQCVRLREISLYSHDALAVASPLVSKTRSHTSTTTSTSTNMTTKSLLAGLGLIALATPVLSVCTGEYTYSFCEPDRIVRYFDPNNGELCGGLDCGGGRAPPRTDVPGCPQYKGTELPITTPQYLPCWTPPGGASTKPTTAAADAVTKSGSSSAAATPSGSESNTSAPPTTQAPTGAGTTTTPTGAPVVTPNAGNRNVAGQVMAAVAGAVVALL